MRGDYWKGEHTSRDMFYREKMVKEGQASPKPLAKAKSLGWPGTVFQI